jgi:ATP-dependent Clp endopeptidase proteolytic subunit ClpP
MSARKSRNTDLHYTWFDHNLDLDSRTIFMGSMMSLDYGESGVDNFMAEYFVKGMHLLEKNSDTKDITVIMNNPGGDWYHGMAIYDSIKNSPCCCTIKVYGYAMSMGSIILQAADKRIMMPNSRMMIHYGYGGVSGHAKITEKWSDEGKRINYEMENIYLEMMMQKEEQAGTGHLARALSAVANKQRMLEVPYPGEVSYKFSKSPKVKIEEARAVLKELLNFDTILNAEESVSLGLADEVFKKEERK